MVSTDLQTHMVSLSEMQNNSLKTEPMREDTSGMSHKLKVQYWPIDEVHPYPNNPRNNDDAVEYVANSIREFSFQQPIVVDTDGTIIAGHTRLKAAKRLGMETVPVVVADNLTPAQVNAYRLADNKVAEAATWDMEALAVELEGLEVDFDMTMFDFDVTVPEDEEADLEPIEADEDELPEISPTRAKTGQIWALGDHRLVCGDSTDPRVVEALMCEEKADLLLTDPPYNVDVGYCERPHSGNNGIHIMNDNMEQGEFVEFLTKAMENAESHMREGAAFYVFYAGLHHAEFAGAVENVENLGIHEQLVWVKSHFAMGRNSDYQWMHECCLYGWKKGANRYFCDSRKEATVIEDEDVKLSTMKKDDLIELCERLLGLDKASTVLRAEKPNAAELHPTVKPQRLLTYLIRNSSQKGETVLDLFCGSGSTIIACEQMGRKCRAVELDPHYADVTIERWERFTGKSAELIGMVE